MGIYNLLSSMGCYGRCCWRQKGGVGHIRQGYPRSLLLPVLSCNEAIFLGWRHIVETGKSWGLKTLLHLTLMTAYAYCPFISCPIDSPLSESLETTQQLWSQCGALLTARNHGRAIQGTCFTPKLLFRRVTCLLNTLSPMSLLTAPHSHNEQQGHVLFTSLPCAWWSTSNPKPPSRKQGRRGDMSPCCAISL